MPESRPPHTTPLILLTSPHTPSYSRSLLHTHMSVASHPRRLTSTTCSSSSAPRSRSKVETKMSCSVSYYYEYGYLLTLFIQRSASLLLPPHTHLYFNALDYSLSLSPHTFHRLPPLLARGRTCVTMPRSLTPMLMLAPIVAPWTPPRKLS